MRNSEFNKTIQDLLKSEYRRVQSFKDYDGSKLWLKSIEKYSLKHILKGDPKKAILREIKAEYALKRIGFPSSGIVYHNQKYIVFKDAGGTLEDIFREKKFSLKIRKEIFQKAGELFGILHSNKYAHGGTIKRYWVAPSLAVVLLEFALCGIVYAAGVWGLSLTTQDRNKVIEAARSALASRAAKASREADDGA